MKKIVSMLLVVTMLLCAFALSACTSGTNNTTTNDSDNSTTLNTEKEQEFYNLAKETQELLDIVADDIYSYWYDCIYKDKYFEMIDYAVACAKSDNEENLNKIEENTTKIKELYKEVRDGKLSDEVKAVMQAYNDYYAMVVEVSGSFQSYSAGKETCKKELSSALSNLSFELD